MNFPVKLKDIAPFEKLNNISVNAYGLESNFKNNRITYKVVGSLYHTERRQRLHIVPFVVYCDFESILPIPTYEPDSKSSFINKIGVHEAYSFAYLIKSSFEDTITKFGTYRGVNAAEEFVGKLEIDLSELYFKYLKDIVPMEYLN